jgi:L-alanine-DL-glutamate epimerase-like enolase superfamily enzyme
VDQFAQIISGGGDNLPRWMRGDFSGLPRSLASGLDSALLDLRGHETGVPLFRLLGAEEWSPPVTSFTLATREPAEMIREAERTPSRILKIKVGFPGDVAAVREIRGRFPEATIRLDANQGWTVHQALTALEALADQRIELVEEPIRGDWGEIESVARNSPIPMILDESVRDLSQLGELTEHAPSVTGVVVKISKMGGPRSSWRLMERAGSLGLGVMIGSMVVSSLGATTSAHLAGAARWTDLDTPWLISEDPFFGMTYNGGAVELPKGPGIGALPVAGGPCDV